MNPVVRKAFAAWLLLALVGAAARLPRAGAQEQVDPLDAAGQALRKIDDVTLRVRVTRCTPEQPELLVNWRRGGEGLGGEVIRGAFKPEGDAETFKLNQWSAALPLATVVGRGDRWEFPSITVEFPAVGRKRPDPPTEIAIEFEFARGGKPLKQFTETAPRGATVGFAFPGGLLREGVLSPAFRDALQGLSGHARSRLTRLEKALGEPTPPPKNLAVLGHLSGYGEAPGAGIGKAMGYKVRHCNPAIVADECRTLEHLGVNALVGAESLKLADAAGMGQRFRRHFWGGPGSGSPMGAILKRGEEEGCPFDPRLKDSMAAAVARAIEEHRAAGAKASWGIWWDEIGVAAKAHLHDCPRCREQFVGYLQRNQVPLAALGAKSWDEVKPFPLWVAGEVRGKPTLSLAKAPDDAAAALGYYWTFRFMTHATAQLFPESAAALQADGVRLYAMQGPTPSWNGSSLDWHEFYDAGANRAFVFETSNRDPRVWQWESYLGDIARGIAARHALPIGCLVKPHRGAASQRMLAVVARGAEAIEWYTYGPDYAKGDSFSQSPELLEEVARAGRFLAQAEDYLVGAKPAQRAEVAFVSPRSAEIWGKAAAPGIAAFEDAKWVYLALRHAHVPVDILSEQQLAEGALRDYKVLYLVGPNLQADAAAPVLDWVKHGGALWTDCLGLSRDEANQSSLDGARLMGMNRRDYEAWGTAPEYRATTLQAFKPSDGPPQGVVKFERIPSGSDATFQAWIGREAITSEGAVLARFADGKPAIVSRCVGKGEVTHVAFWAGLSYSAQVRRDDYVMRDDFDPVLRQTIATTAIMPSTYRPVVPAEPLVEAILLENGGRQSIALMNWAYRRSKNPVDKRGEELVSFTSLRIDLPGVSATRRVRSLRHGPLTLDSAGGPHVILPKLEKIDLLVIE